MLGTGLGHMDEIVKQHVVRTALVDVCWQHAFERGAGWLDDDVTEPPHLAADGHGNWMAHERRVADPHQTTCLACAVRPRRYAARMPTPPQRIVVTGGAGYVGSMLIPRLLAAGHRVHCVDNLMFGANAILPLFIDEGFTFAEADVRDRDAMARELEGADVVIHLAALVGYPLCKKMPREAVEVNVDGTRNVLDLMPADARLLYGCFWNEVLIQDFENSFSIYNIFVFYFLPEIGFEPT